MKTHENELNKRKKKNINISFVVSFNVINRKLNVRMIWHLCNVNEEYEKKSIKSFIALPLHKTNLRLNITLQF